MLKNARSFLKSIRTDLLICFGVAITIILSIDLWLIDKPQIINKGYEIGQIFYKLSMSYISAFIFYLLIVHYKARTDKRNIKPYLVKKVNKVIASSILLVSAAKPAGLIDFEGVFPTPEQATELFSGIDPKAEAPLNLVIRMATWKEYLNFHKQNSDVATNQLFQVMPYLDTKLVKLLTQVQDCPYFSQVHMIAQYPLNNEDFSWLAGSFYDYTVLIKELDTYANNNLRDLV